MGGAGDRRFVLPARSRATLRSLAAVVCPPEIGTLGLVEAVVEHVELSLRSLDPALRRLVMTSVGLIDVGALVRGRRCCDLDEGRASAYVRYLATSRSAMVRLVFRPVRDLLVVAYYEHPAVRSRMGYDPERWIADVSARRIVRWHHEIQAHSELLIRPWPLKPSP